MIRCSAQLLAGEGRDALSKLPRRFFLGVGGAVGRQRGRASRAPVQLRIEVREDVCHLPSARL
eukprot:4885566-Pyramimonas_sp.AAC.1